MMNNSETLTGIIFENPDIRIAWSLTWRLARNRCWAVCRDLFGYADTFRRLQQNNIAAKDDDVANASVTHATKQGPLLKYKATRHMHYAI